MYSKEEIIAEIQRVAKYLKAETVTAAQFQEYSTVPLNTVEFFLGSWRQALAEAHLIGTVKREPTSKDLLAELWRIHQETGEIPTYALIDRMGLWNAGYYQQNWRSLEVPFKLAQRYFGGRKEYSAADGDLTDAGRTQFYAGESAPLEIPAKQTTAGHDPNEDSQDLDAQLAATVVSAPIPLFAKPVAEPPVVAVKVQPEPEPEPEPDIHEKTGEVVLEPAVTTADDEGQHFPDYHVQDHDPQQPVVIPDLPVGTRLSGERIFFRGLLFPPTDRLGVAFLFGMVANELGFFLETAGDEVNGFCGWRTLRLDETEWAPVKLFVAQRSSDLIGQETKLAGFTHLLCWDHDWSICPLPVIGLSGLIGELPNYKRPR